MGVAPARASDAQHDRFIAVRRASKTLYWTVRICAVVCENGTQGTVRCLRRSQRHMVELGYKLSSEEHSAPDLVGYARRAESAGFSYLAMGQPPSGRDQHLAEGARCRHRDAARPKPAGDCLLLRLSVKPLRASRVAARAARLRACVRLRAEQGRLVRMRDAASWQCRRCAVGWRPRSRGDDMRARRALARRESPRTRERRRLLCRDAR